MKTTVTHTSQSGLSLIELMVAITLGLMITSSLGYILMGSRSTYRTQDASARIQDTGRFAMEFIGRQLRSAGRIDITPLASDPRTSLIGLPENWSPISGSNGAAAGEDTEASNSDGEVAVNGGNRQTDRLTVQYQETTLGGNTPQDCNGAAVPLLGTVGSGGDQYGTIQNAISLDGANLELECTGNGGGGAQPFTEGVEDLQFRYAEAGTPSVFQDASQVSVWANVVAVQVCLMVQSTANGVVNTAQNIRDCEGEVYTPNDTRLRRTFTSVFTLRNRINAVP
jgi:type IV pilus assembly protein PilW